MNIYVNDKRYDETVDDRTFGQKVKDGANKVYQTAKTGVENTANWIKDHKKETVVLASIFVPMAIDIYKTVSRNAEVKTLKKHEDKMVYDPSMGFYYDLKRKMTNNERAEFETRVRSGETRGAVLRDMGLLSR